MNFKKKRPLFFTLFSLCAQAPLGNNLSSSARRKSVHTLPARLLRLILVLIVFTNHAYAQWSTDPAVNNAICVAGGDQYYQTITSDGSGGAIITWTDYRAGAADIYAQRIDANGVVQWTTDGVAICKATNYQLFPTIISDNSGGAIITWYDFRNGGTNANIYAQKINASGVVQWTVDGVAICTAINDQQYPAIISDDNAGAIITWYDYRNGTANGDIYAQRINASGVVQWAVDGIAICLAPGYQQYPSITSDASGGGIITWIDQRNGVNFDIYTQRIDANGTVQWITDGVALCTATADQIEPIVVSDGSAGAIISWMDRRNGPNYDVYVQRINASGVVQWVTDGVAICTAVEDQDGPLLISDGSSGAIITWFDRRSGADFDVYAQRINASGIVQWATDGIAISTATNDQSSPTITSDGSTGAIITWRDIRLGSYDIYAQHINASGVTQWTTDGVPISTAVLDQVFPTLVEDGSAGAIITWTDYRNGSGTFDTYAQHVNADGSLTTGPPTITITITTQPSDFSTCEGSIATFNTLATGTTNITYQWQFSLDGIVFNDISNGGNYSGVTAPTLSVNTTGNFGEGRYRCKISGDLASTIFTNDEGLFFSSPTTPTIAIKGTQLTASSGDSYQWYQNGDAVFGATSQSFDFDLLEYGLYKVDVTDNGCTSTSLPFEYLIMAIEKDNVQIKLYPNPVVEELTIEIPPNLSHAISIVDMMGRECIGLSVNGSGKQTISLKEFQPGSYVLLLQSAQSKRYFKIVKQ